MVQRKGHNKTSRLYNYPVCLWSDQPLYDIPGQLVPASLSSLWNAWNNEGKIDLFYENSIGYVPFVLPYAVFNLVSITRNLYLGLFLANMKKQG